MALSRKEVKFYTAESALLDTLYEKKIKGWQKLVDYYDNKFDQQIRDLDLKEIVAIPRFYPLVRDTLAAIAFNYPTMFFTVEDDDGQGQPVSDILERAAAAYMRLAKLKPHVQQALFDALFCQVGWLRLDYNPPGDDLIPPYIANDAMAEDLVVVSRAQPGFVHLDPTCPPHILGHARYIREKMWVPTKLLRDDKQIKNRNQIKSTTTDSTDEVQFGVQAIDREESLEARRKSVDNGEFTLVDRWHDRMNKRLIMFADGVESEILERPHPFIKMNFEQRFDAVRNLLTDEDGEPIVDLARGTPAAGWLVENGFGFIPIKFDLSYNSFYPTAHMAYLEDLQLAAVEFMSRQNASLKRGARQGLVNQAETENNPNLLDNIRKGNDGQYHDVLDIHNFGDMPQGNLPPELYAYGELIRGYEGEVTRINELTQGGGDARTATEAGLIASAASVRREWMEASVAGVYEASVRNPFQIMGDPRYTPDSFLVNVAPNGQQALSRALKTADFLWTYRIEVQAGSTRPLFEEMQRGRALEFFDRASQREGFDQQELDKFLANLSQVADPERLLKDDVNEEAQRAAQLENDFMLRTLQDPGVVPGQDHQAHLQVHPKYQNMPQYQELMQIAQAIGPEGQPLNGQAVQQVQFIDQLMEGHLLQHQQALEEGLTQATAPREAPNATQIDTVSGQVNRSAQNLQIQVDQDTLDLKG
jgi:hypothetical protein